MEHDSWGKRRNETNGTDDPTCSITSQTDRGFTGREMLSRFCLINMNARLYDPSLGRFMAADSIVPGPYDTQAHNRFSYVDNNPLNATDPTGHGGSAYQDSISAMLEEWTLWASANCDQSIDIGEQDAHAAWVDGLALRHKAKRTLLKQLRKRPIQLRINRPVRSAISPDYPRQPAPCSIRSGAPGFAILDERYCCRQRSAQLLRASAEWMLETSSFSLNGFSR